MDAPYRIEFIHVSPGLAKAWLETNHDNRKIRPRKVATFARDMKAGRWKLNGQGVSFDENGNLLDGQHRLLALIEANVVVVMECKFGVARSTFDTIDMGDPRRPSDVLRMQGEVNAFGLSAACRLLRAWQEIRATRPRDMAHYPVTAGEIEETLAEFGELRFFAKLAAGGLHRFLQPSIGAVAMYLCTQADPVLAPRFFEQLRTGEGLVTASPIYRLRERLLDNRAAKAKLPQPEVFAIVIKAWNAYATGKSMGGLVWKSDEPFPEVKSLVTREVAPTAERELVAV